MGTGGKTEKALDESVSRKNEVAFSIFEAERERSQELQFGIFGRVLSAEC